MPSRRSFALILLLGLVSGCRPAPNPTVLGDRAAFVAIPILRADGERIVDVWGKSVALHGVVFGNHVWQDVIVPSLHHDAEDYRRVAALGLNSVRFYLNPLTLEDPTEPGRYRPEGWAWLDENLHWARQHGVLLVLSMQIPERGMWALGERESIFSSAPLQRRFLDLWAAIATRYRGEPAIAGYDLLGDPGEVPREVWRHLAERTLASVRRVDPEHLIFLAGTTPGADTTGRAGTAPDAARPKQVKEPLVETAPRESLGDSPHKEDALREAGGDSGGGEGSPPAYQESTTLDSRGGAKPSTPAGDRAPSSRDEPASSRDEPQTVLLPGSSKEAAKPGAEERRQRDPDRAVEQGRAAESGPGSGVANKDRHFFRVSDPNVVYEFQFYEPFDFTHQSAPWALLAAAEATYPAESRAGVERSGLGQAEATVVSPELPAGSSQWTRYEVAPFTVTDPELALGRPVLACRHRSGQAFFDDLVIEEVAPDGEVRRVLVREDLDTARGWRPRFEPAGARIRVAGGGHGDDHCLMLDRSPTGIDLLGDAWMFPTRGGATYRMSGWMRGQAIPALPSCHLVLELLRSPVRVWGQTREFLAAELDAYVAWGKREQVPLYVGEWGTISYSFEAGRGGLQWAEDVLDLLLERELSFALFSYHENHMGLYYGSASLPDPAWANTPLLDLLKNGLLKAPPAQP